MGISLEHYYNRIKALPIKDSYTKEELLVPDFLIERQGNIEIYYAPHNEYINNKAIIFIIGITPGFQQMSIAISAARKEIDAGTCLDEIKYRCKVAGRFSGSLRKNLCNMLDEISLHHVLHLKSCSELFAEKEEFIHTISLIPFSTFVKKQNYSGHTPKLINTPFLMKYVYEYMIIQLKQIQDYPNVLLIPLGSAVEEVLFQLAKDGLLRNEQILSHFPHPSGANVNRLNQLEKYKDEMTMQIMNQVKR